jgi:hypothetical protein
MTSRSRREMVLPGGVSLVRAGPNVTATLGGVQVGLAPGRIEAEPMRRAYRASRMKPISSRLELWLVESNATNHANISVDDSDGAARSRFMIRFPGRVLVESLVQVSRREPGGSTNHISRQRAVSNLRHMPAASIRLSETGVFGDLPNRTIITKFTSLLHQSVRRPHTWPVNPVCPAIFATLV